MPLSLPVTTGLPLSSGFSACSTLAKNASQSIWRMVLLPVFPDHGNDDPSDGEFVFGPDGRVFDVGGAKDNAGRGFVVVLHCPVAVDLSDDDVFFFGLSPPLDNHE